MCTISNKHTNPHVRQTSSVIQCYTTSNHIFVVSDVRQNEHICGSTCQTVRFRPVYAHFEVQKQDHFEVRKQEIHVHQFETQNVFESDVQDVGMI